MKGRSRPARRVRFGVAMLGAAVALALLGGCHHRLPKLNAQGRHAEVVERVEGARFRPKRKAARAYADSLHALGRDRQALDALLLDYRRGGHVESLIALADLERDIGWNGLAAHHYARVLTHDRNALEGRKEVCDLFRERAREYLHAAEGEAADLDMRRVRLMCGAGSPDDEALAAEADAAAQAQVDARVEAGLCPLPCKPPSETPSLAPDLDAARAKSPVAVATLAVMDARQLPAEVIVELLQTESRGELGISLLEDDTIRGWIGAQSWSDLAPAVMSATGPVAAYTQLRLASVLSDMPRAPGRAGDRELDRWTEQALRIPDVDAWRVYAAQGDIATAELSHAGRWRPPKPVAAEGEAAPSRVAHWSQRLPVDAGTVEAALVAARLRDATGKHDLALELTLRVFRAAADAKLGVADALARESTISAIGWGRPWQALAILETGAVSDPAALRAAAASAVVLNRTMCDGSCRDDDDLGVALRVMGEAWVESTRASLLDWSLARRIRPEATGGCPTVAELTEPDTPGPLADALRAARDDLRAPGVGDALAAAIASDLRSWCAAKIVLPAMVEGQHALPAARLSDALSHAPESKAVGDLATQSKLALVAGQPERGMLLAVAAAGESAEPRAVWLDAAAFAATAGDRELELRALREALVATPGLRDDAVRRRLLLAGLGDIEASWGLERPQGRDALRADVLDVLDPVPREQRWHAERSLFDAVWRDGLPARLDADQRALLIEVLGGQTWMVATHPRALARLNGEEPAPGTGPLHDEGMADDARAGRLKDLPPITVSLTDPRNFEDARMALASTARDWSVRRRMAISLLVLGTADARRVGWKSLLSMAEASSTPQTEALRDLVVQRPAALAPMWERWAPVGPTVVLEGQENLVRVVLGLDLSPSLVAP
jgi:hypothetical protein